MNTIEMLSKIKLGQIAKCLDTEEEMYGVKRIESGIYWIKDKNADADWEDGLELTGLVLDDYTWELESNEIKVEFHEAMKALKEGYLVAGEYSGFRKHYTLNVDENVVIAPERILEGKWYIIYG